MHSLRQSGGAAGGHASAGPRTGIPFAMNPLFFANWHLINARFKGLMWLLALALAVFILAHSLPSSSPAHTHQVRDGSALATGG